MIEPGEESLLLHFGEEHVQRLVGVYLLVHGWIQAEVQELGVSMRLPPLAKPFELDFLLLLDRRQQLVVDRGHPFFRGLFSLTIRNEVGYDFNRRNCSLLSGSSEGIHFIYNLLTYII